MNQTLSYGQAAAMQLYQGLLPFSFFFCVAGFIVSAVKRVDTHGWLKTIALTAIVGGAVAGFPNAINSFATELKSLANLGTAGSFDQLLGTDLSHANKPDVFNLWNCIGYALAIVAQKVGMGGRLLIVWLQGVAINGLVAVCPICLGFITLEYTRSVGINFLLVSFGVTLWSIGIAIVNVTLDNLAPALLPTFGLGSGLAVLAAAGGWVALAAGLIAMVIVSNAMYLAVPFAVAALMKGHNPLTSGVTAGAGLAATGLELSSKIGLTNLLGSGLEHGAGKLRNAFHGSSEDSPSSTPSNVPRPSISSLAYPAPGAGVPTGEERTGGFTGSRIKPTVGALASTVSAEAIEPSTPTMTSDSVPAGARSVGPTPTDFRQSIMAKYGRQSTIAALDESQIQGGN